MEKRELADYFIIFLLLVMLVFMFFIFQEFKKEGGKCVLDPINFLFDKYNKSTNNVSCYCSAFQGFNYESISFEVPKESYKI
jgi:hypothetical protein